MKRSVVGTIVLSLFLLIGAACDDTTGPDDRFPVMRTEQISEMTFWVPSDSVATSDATAELTVNGPQSFRLTIDADGLEPGHAYTVWAFDATVFAGGRVAGGVVSEDGTLSLGGDNCVDAAQTETGLGKKAGEPPVCGLIDLSTPVPSDLESRVTGVGLPATADDDFVAGLNVFLLDHGPWNGDPAALWTTEGRVLAHGAFLFDLTDVFEPTG